MCYIILGLNEKNMYKFCLVITIILSASICLGQVFVNKNSTGTNDGTSWKNAYTDLDEAINLTISGEIWVAAGIYKPSTDLDGMVPSDEREKTFRLKENIAIYGGFIGNESSLSERDWESNKTILSGDIGIEDDRTDNSFHVISAEYADLDQLTILDGLTVRDGYSQNSGAGIYVNNTSGGSFIIRNCIIENNYSIDEGGGLYVFNSNPLIVDNIFKNNRGYEGGGIYIHFSNALIQNNEIINNEAASGGGVFVNYNSSPTIKNNLIQGNSAISDGGGVKIDDNNYTVFESNRVIRNTSRNGGGLFLDFSRTYFFNNVFAKNNASERGGGIYMNYTPGPRFINNTVVNNLANISGGGMYLSASNIDIINSILYSNRASTGNQMEVLIQRSDWFPKVHYCTVEGGEIGIKSNGTITYENNYEITPEFDNPTDNHYQLIGISDLINRGTLDASLMNLEDIQFPEYDMANNSRVFNDTIDIGAYEVQSLKQFKPTDITLSSNHVDQSASIETIVGELYTTDKDSESFQYEVIEGGDFFSVVESQLITSSSLLDQTETPIALRIKSIDEDGWSFEKEFEIEIFNIVLSNTSNSQSVISVFPNPTSNIIYLSRLPSSEIEIKIISIDGKLMPVQLSRISNNDSSINLGNLDSGIYMIYIITPKETLTKRIILDN